MNIDINSTNFAFCKDFVSNNESLYENHLIMITIIRKLICFAGTGTNLREQY